MIAAIVVYVAAIFWIAHTWGVAYGVPVAMAAVLAYDWFQVPPTHPLEIPDTANLEELLVFFALAVLVGEAAAYASQRATCPRRRATSCWTSRRRCGASRRSSRRRRRRRRCSGRWPRRSSAFSTSMTRPVPLRG